LKEDKSTFAKMFVVVVVVVARRVPGLMVIGEA